MLQLVKRSAKLQSSRRNVPKPRGPHRIKGMDELMLQAVGRGALWKPEKALPLPKPILHESDPRRQTTLKLQNLLQQQPNLTQACAARIIGVSRQRIQQINAEKELGMVKLGWLSWPCPLCGAEVRKRRFAARRINSAKAVYCKACQPRICHNGHVDAPHRSSGNCVMCERERGNRVIRYRICIDCGKELPVTYDNERLARYFGYKLERCKSCHFKRIRHLQQREKKVAS